MKRIIKYSVELVKESAKTYDIIDTDMSSSTKAGNTVMKLFDFEKWHNEKFGVVCLDSQNRIIGVHIVSEGTVNEAPVFTREIATRALLNNAISVLLFHNHPGGTLSPSRGDIEATKAIRKGLETLSIKVLDHIIIADGKYVSFAERGILE